MVDPRPGTPGRESRRGAASNAGGDRFAGRAGRPPAWQRGAAGAQGTAGETFVENTQARDEGLEDMGLDPQDPSGELTDPAPPDTVPSVVDVPYASQQEGNLSATMGNWTGEPTSYAYQWRIDGAVVGTDSAVYTVQAADVGKNATCTVTATNALGSTVAPLSNEAVVAG